MVVCPGGSTANNSSLGTIQMSGSYLNSILPGGLQWFDSYLWLIPPFTIDIPTFCAAEPPALPVLGADDILSIVTGGRIGSTIVGINKGIQLLQVYAWYNLCHCTAGGTPAPPAGQAPPAGLPVVNPPGVNPYVIACATQTSAQQSVPPSTFVNQANARLPAGALTINLTMSNVVFGATPGGMQWAYAFFDSTGNSLVGAPTLPPVASGVSRTDTISVPTNAERFNASVTCGAVVQTNKAQTQMDVFCTVAPNVPVNPPDPQTSGLLQQILNMVTLIQRQAVPFAYVPGAVHAGLSGAGTLAISGLIGASIDITTLPGALSREGSAPLEIFDAGFITFGTPDGYPSSYRLEHDPELLLPARCSAYTYLAYDLHPGVVVTITELKREP